MKKLLTIFVLTAAIFFAGCKKDDNTVNATDSPVLTSISGTIDGWNYGSNLQIKLSVYEQNAYIDFGSSPVSSSGVFNINQLSAPAAAQLSLLTDNIEPNITLSNPNAKVLSAGLRIGDANQTLGLVTKSLFGDGRQGDFVVQYVYFDSDCSISGTGAVENGHQTVYNANIKKGWNQIVRTITSNTNNEIKYSITLVEPAGGKFYFIR